MAEESAKLRIPYIAAAQAQKHVTHNEAMTLLDTLVQLSVLDKDLTAPPSEPEDGDCYIVAGAGGTATGAWAGWERRVARFIDGEWRSYLPGQGAGAGWLAWVLDEDAMYRFDGEDWALAGIEGPEGPAGPAGEDGQSFQPDAVVALIAGRDTYDDEPAAFSVLVVSDSSNDDAPTLYFKLSGTSADWSDGITFAPEGGGAGAPAVGTDRLAPHEGLVVKYVSAASVDIDAKAILLKDASGNAVRAENVDLTVSITGSGANGLDAGSEANSTWYHLWVIHNGSTVAGLLSTSATAPTLPGGYTHKGYVGAVRNDSGGSFKKFLQIGDTVSVNMIDNAAVSNGAATSFTAVDLSAMVPPTAAYVHLWTGIRTSSGSATVQLFVASGGAATTPDIDQTLMQAPIGTTYMFFSPFFWPMNTPQQIKYYVAGANAQTNINVAGWRY